MTVLDHKTVLSTVTRIVNAGPIDALPRRRADLDVLLALACARFQYGRAYREDEVNEELLVWLESFATNAVDHVSVRRELVDRQLLLRDAAGAAYRLNRAGLDALIDVSARTVDPGDVMSAVQLRREERKRARDATR